ncbi:MAG: hypothetical protein SFV19_15040 [Rhodospirillaceae bacterium]|nr:hypothetical protein [Rhodospirillaceae bacterium]
MDAFWIALTAKAVSTALVVVAASVVAERVGPKWGGLVACFPVSAGPAYVLLALQHDARFIAESALASLACGVATWAFLASFVTFAQRRGLWPSLLGALGVWFVLAATVRAVPWSVTGAALANVAAFIIAVRLTPRTVAHGAALTRPPSWAELPVRALLVGLFVAMVVTVSDAIGPAVTGIAAVFPITLSSLAVVLNRSFGVAGAAAALRGAIKPIIGIACGLTVLALTPLALGVWPALGVSLLAALAWPMIMIAQGALRRSSSS